LCSAPRPTPRRGQHDLGARRLQDHIDKIDDGGRRMKILALLTVAAGMALSAPAQAQDAAGDWSGTLVVNESLSVPLVVHIRRDDAGALSGTMDSPSQGATGIPLAGVEVADGRLVFTVPAIQGRYEGTRSEEHTSELQSRENIVC